RLAEASGMMPEIPAALHEAAESGPGPAFRAALGSYLKENPKAAPFTVFIVARTLGRVLGSVNLGGLYGLLMAKPKSFWENAARAGFEPGADVVERLFQAIMDNPQGVWIGKCDTDDNFAELATPDGRINLEIPELEAELAALTPAAEQAALKPDAEYPLILMAGHHMAYNANTLLRDPSWIGANRYCTLQMHPDDVAGRGLSDGQTVTVSTIAGSLEIELEETDSASAGQVVMPHGFGMINEDGVNGVNVNRLTSTQHRDPRVGTPFHRYVPCQVTG
ncbi:MAG: molybdopterin dinucleotide binding domain-containing protein, partial [Alphaproteobacteria bacterium]|nr:molybdopterin dinucleotide binding domain-containing protein [Alphaproteobacteria bacterium]